MHWWSSIRSRPHSKSAHRNGVIHRDVKPENILFDAAGRAHLGDFGIAIEAARALPALAAASGSPTFAPPEQLRFEPVGPEADVYALAMVASLLLTGGNSSGDSDARDPRGARHRHGRAPGRPVPVG